MRPELTTEQQYAVDRRDSSLLVRAGAGTGKTSVLVERLVRAVVDDGVAVEAILAITFTEKAAAQLRGRVRERFVELGRRDLARDAERAWISTIHGFCSRVLRTHALAAGVDPEYRVLDELEGERLGIDAFDRALERFLAGGADPVRLEMVAAYTPDTLQAMVRTAFGRLRSQGQRHPELEELQAPKARGERRELEAAARSVLMELGAAEGGRRAADAAVLLERCGAALGRVSDIESLEPVDVQAFRLKGTNARALQSEACEAYERARGAYESWCIAHRAHRTHVLLRELLALYGERYEELKRSRSGLDFEDLQLMARDLLLGKEGLREEYARRFEHVMVDEFQDTNPLQNEIVGLLGGRLFRVGDENQSIYGFRHADVEIFRRHQAAAEATGEAARIAVNFRSRGELLDGIDLAFGRVWGDIYEPLRERPGSRSRPARIEPCLELLVVDKDKGRWDERFAELEDPFGATLRSTPAWRACEARLLARRIDELVAEGGFAAGDVALLVRASTDIGVYERALEERGIDIHVVGGRGYWGQQQVGDLRHWLAALANPLDELALYSVLASPFVGASLDAVALLGLYARRRGRDPWRKLREELAPGAEGTDGLADVLPPADRHRLTAFVERFAAERQAAPRVSLETLIDRAVTETGYDQRVLALPAGERRMANVRKLMRMAREYEADEGRELRGFIDFVAERDLIQEREGEAPLEAEAHAVQLMTVHRAKGLEFPVVCLADLGRAGREDYGALRISDDGRVGLRHASLGGGSVNSAQLEEIKSEQRLADEAEERRIFYVAVTRAKEHLVLSGATDLVKRSDPQPLAEPMRWLWRAFAAAVPEEEARGELVDAYEGREVRVRFERCAPDTVDELLPVEDRAPSRPAPPVEAPPAFAPLELAAVSAPPTLPVSRLSYSGLESFRRCGYRFYLERALRLPGAEGALAADPEIEPVGGGGLSSLVRGAVVHELLERIDFRRPRPPAEGEVAARLHAHGARAAEGEAAEIAGLVRGFLDSPLRERLSHASRVRAELPFAFTLAPGQAGGRSLLVNGVVDVHALEGDRVLVVDYKSDRLGGREPAELVEGHYSTQRLVYGLAALRGGAERVEVAHLLLERPGAPISAAFSAGDAPDLESTLRGLVGAVMGSSFAPSEHPHLELCATCPGRPDLCRWGPERTLARSSSATLP